MPWKPVTRPLMAREAGGAGAFGRLREGFTRPFAEEAVPTSREALHAGVRFAPHHVRARRSRQAAGPPAGPWRTHGFVVPSVRGEGRRRRPRRGRSRRPGAAVAASAAAHRPVHLASTSRARATTRPRDLQRHRRGGGPRGGGLQRPVLLQRRNTTAGLTIALTGSVAAGRRLRPRPADGRRRDPRRGGPDRTRARAGYNGNDAVVLRKGSHGRRRPSGRSASTRRPSGAPA